MKKLRNFITPLHKSAKRDYFDRMLNEKAKCIKIAKKYDYHYWDGSRRTGYGGYKYIPGHWKGMAQQLIKDYNLKAGSNVLDVGCGAGLLSEPLARLGAIVTGIDAAEENIETACQHSAKDPIGKMLHKA